MAEIRSDMSIEELKKEASERAAEYEKTYHGCSRCTMRALQEVLGIEDELLLKATGPVSGGLALTGHTCGALSAGVMLMGMKFGTADFEEGFAGMLKGMLPAYKLIEWFKAEFGDTNCSKIAGFQMDQASLEGLIADPTILDGMLAEHPELIEKCTNVVGKTAAKVVELVAQETK